LSAVISESEESGIASPKKLVENVERERLIGTCWNIGDIPRGEMLQRPALHRHQTYLVELLNEAGQHEHGRLDREPGSLPRFTRWWNRHQHPTESATSADLPASRILKKSGRKDLAAAIPFLIVRNWASPRRGAGGWRGRSLT